MKKAMIVLCALYTAAFVLAGASARAETEGIKAFFGHYVGRSDVVIGEGLADRDFTVIIEPFKKSGFTLKWTTIIRYTDRPTKKKSHAVTFIPYRKRPGIYYSAVERDVFGHATPSDPLSGDPYVWAALKDQTLTVNALYVLDDGGYELQIFRRSLEEGGLVSHFERMRNGERMRLITGRLEKLKK